MGRQTDVHRRTKKVVDMPLSALGASDLVVSRLALGSWRTYERLSAEAGLAVMRAARDVGITFLDDARYDDETGTAPIPTGYSEVIFGELFRQAGWRRDETVIANKLWWEFWPDQSAADELDASLARMGMDHVDLIYANPAPEGLGLEELVESVTGLIAAGKTRAWGVVNWPADAIADVSAIAARLGVSQPCAAQLPYSLVQRAPVEDDHMVAALKGSRAAVVASFVLAGGVLTGKYHDNPATGRAAGTLDQPRVAAAAAAGARLRELAATLDTSPAALAVAFTLSNPMVASVLFGATSPEQVHQNAAALEIADALDDAQIARLRRLGSPDT
jgi:aryl-alcohol dehydrogenase-like predicted oxidoreductase